MDKREDQPRQSSLPSSLHPHIVTRPHPQTPQQGSSSSSRTGRIPHGETGEAEETFNDSPYRLPPFAPSLSPATFGDDGQRASGSYVRHETYFPEQDDTFDEDNRGRMFIPLPRRAINRRAPGPSSIPHGLPSIRSVFNSPFPSYAYTVSNYNLPVPDSPERTPTPPWQEGEAGPSSLASSRPDQGQQRGRSETDNLTQTDISARERIESSPLGYRTFEWEVGQTDRYGRPGAPAQRAHVPDTSEVVSGEFVGRGSTVSAAQLIPGRSHLQHSGQLHDPRRHHSLPSEFEHGHPNFVPNRVEDDASAAAPYTSQGSISSGEGDDLPPPYPHSIASPSISVKKELEESQTYLIERPGQQTGDLEAPPRKKARKKAVVACNFCQRRKLRCSTERPKCSNCGQRGLLCVYGPPKRRGPGKAPRGSRSKKMPTAQESAAPPPPFANDDFRPAIPAYTYPYPPHLRSEFERPVLTMAPLAPSDVGSEQAGTRRTAKRPRSESSEPTTS